MAGPVWGTAEIRVTADGTILPAQIRRLSEKAGDDAGTSFSKEFNKALDREGKKSFGTRFKSFFRDLNKELLENSGHWKDLSHNTRQWTLIIGTVAAALPALTNLISAAGVGILALGSALGSLVVGGAVAISTFSRFMGDIEKVPEDTKKAREAFDGLKDTFSELNEELTSRAFRNSTKAWESLSKTVRGLEEPLGKVADVIGQIVDDFAEWAASESTMKRLTTFIENSARVFDSLVRTVGKFGDALLTAFTNPAMVSAVDGLTGWLGDLADGFNNFVNSPAYTEWVTNGVSVFEHLGGLLESLGTALSGLFDKQTTDDLNDFIDALGDFLEGPGKSLIDFLDQLDVPGVLVSALNNLGSVIQLLADFLTDFMEANPELVKGALEGLATALGAIALVKITSAIVTPIQGLVALATGKNTSKINKFAAAFAGLGIALGSIASDPNAENGSAATAAIGGALAGLQFGGPIGALVGTLAGLISSMISDVFLTPEVKGSWQTGWDQLFDPNNYSGMGIGELKLWFQQNLMGPDPSIPESGGGWLDQVVTNWANTLEGFKTGVPVFFEGLGQAFADGWAAVAAWYDTNFGQPIEQGWNQFINFFAVSVPGFFASAGQWFSDGWNGLVKWFTQTFVEPTKTAWRSFVNFWTVEVPAWFNRMVSAFQNGLNRLIAPFTGFFGDVQRNWNNFWSSLGTAANNAWNTVRSVVDRIVAKIREIASNPFGAIGNLFSGQGFASGGVLMGPRRILAGEAGPEAIVPLSRPLNQVDPSVRALSAIAQGLTPMAGGGVVGGRSITFASGAFQINGALDPQRTALTVANRIAERVAG